jgi:hypothetical protein
MSCLSEAEIEIIPSRIELMIFCITFQCCTTAPYLLSYEFIYSTMPDMDGDYSYRSFKDTVYIAPPPTQHTEAKLKVPDLGDKVDFTALLLFLALSHSIFSLLVHSFFGTVS